MKSVFLALLIFFTSHSVLAMTDKEVADGYRACQKFVKMSHAQQVQVAGKTSYTVQQGLQGCKTMLSHSLAYDQKMQREYERETSAASGAPVVGTRDPIHCDPDSSGTLYCGYGVADPDKMRCGTPEVGHIETCTDATGAPTSVTCYTNLSNYTSCN